jgi:benzoate/toluate 1,2-dioxygenase reductase component
MSHRIALNFEDGVTRFIDCAPTETVADASYKLGINIPLDCRDGACGTCKAFCESGQYDGGSYIEDALTDEEAEEGYVLACQMRPKSDCVLRIAASSDVCKTKGAAFQAQLSGVDRLSDTAIAFSLKVDPAAKLSYLPGQYANLAVPGTDQKRSYSFSSPPGSHEVSFLVRNIPAGRMSTFLRERAELGVQLEFTGPAGTFYLRDINRPVLFLAGGTGLAPFLSMLGKVAKEGSEHPIHMVYGVTNDPDLVGVEQLEAFTKQIPNFTFSCCIADESGAYPNKGYVTRYIEPKHLNGGEVDVYLCGPPPMVEAVRKWLADQGVAPANFYYEKFSPSGAVTAVGEDHRK